MLKMTLVRLIVEIYFWLCQDFGDLIFLTRGVLIGFQQLNEPCHQHFAHKVFHFFGLVFDVFGVFLELLCSFSKQFLKRLFQTFISLIRKSLVRFLNVSRKLNHITKLFGATFSWHAKICKDFITFYLFHMTTNVSKVKLEIMLFKTATMKTEIAAIFG